MYELIDFWTSTKKAVKTVIYRKLSEAAKIKGSERLP